MKLNKIDTTAFQHISTTCDGYKVVYVFVDDRTPEFFEYIWLHLEEELNRLRTLRNDPLSLEDMKVMIEGLDDDYLWYLKLDSNGIPKGVFIVGRSYTLHHGDILDTFLSSNLEGSMIPFTKAVLKDLGDLAGVEKVLGITKYINPTLYQTKYIKLKRS